MYCIVLLGGPRWESAIKIKILFEKSLITLFCCIHWSQLELSRTKWCRKSKHCETQADCSDCNLMVRQGQTVGCAEPASRAMQRSLASSFPREVFASNCARPEVPIVSWYPQVLVFAPVAIAFCHNSLTVLFSPSIQVASPPWPPAPKCVPAGFWWFLYGRGSRTNGGSNSRVFFRIMYHLYSFIIVLYDPFIDWAPKIGETVDRRMFVYDVCLVYILHMLNVVEASGSIVSCSQIESCQIKTRLTISNMFKMKGLDAAHLQLQHLQSILTQDI